MVEIKIHVSFLVFRAILTFHDEIQAKKILFDF
jgi:hypothetical protein